ncbi:MAG: N-acetylmuramoyl-L-alanine amidase [Alphaproteobacteria bacterium]|nr:N-acetylmuramoyl-L-alanine amidase [Alphaproteobacteria bacterium]
MSVSAILSRVFVLCHIITLILWLGAVGAPALAQTQEITGARFGVHPEKTRLVLDLKQPSDFRAFVLAQPDRLIVDLPEFRWNVGHVDHAPGSQIRELRSGLLQPGYSRLVVDSAVPIQMLNAFLIPAQGGQGHRLVIDFKKISQAQATPSRIFGQLKIAGANSVQGGTVLPPLPAVKPHVSQPDAKLNPASPSRPSQKQVVVIDPGHGGQDPGAVAAGGIYEKTVTLAAAKQLKQKLEESGRYQVFLTRDRDVFIKLGDRVKIARKHKADLFVSIHADSIDKSDVRGMSIYTLSNTASDAQTERLAARENKADLIGGVDLSHEDKDVANILIDLVMRDTMNQSKFFANTIVTQMNKAGVKTLERPHRFAGFAVLKAADIPSVLIEIGFMSNPKEARALNSPEYRHKITQAIQAGIDAYFDKVQKNNKN